MLDAVVGVGTVGVYWLGAHSWREIPLSGYPLAGILIAIAWFSCMFPPECYEYAPSMHDTFSNSVLSALMTTCVADFVQFWVHMATHRKLLGERLYAAHAIHHTHTHPTPINAFHTGVADAVAQLMLPLFLAVWVVRPDRSGLLLFGMAYSHWLTFLHSAPNASRDAILHRMGLVSPSRHARHHTHPRESYAHVFDWDRLLLHERPVSKLAALRQGDDARRDR